MAQNSRVYLIKFYWNCFWELQILWFAVIEDSIINLKWRISFTWSQWKASVRHGHDKIWAVEVAQKSYLKFSSVLLKIELRTNKIRRTRSFTSEPFYHHFQLLPFTAQLSWALFIGNCHNCVRVGMDGYRTRSSVSGACICHGRCRSWYWPKVR